MTKRKKKTKKKPVTWKIECKDCIKGMRQMQKDGQKPNLIFADPPYNIGVAYDSHHDNMDLTDYEAWCNNWISEAYQTLHRRGSFWLAISDEHVSELDVMAKAIGFYKRSHVLWHFTFGVACQKNFSRSHIHLLYYTKTKTGFTWNGNDVRVPSARQLVYSDIRADPRGKLPDNTWVLAPEDTQKAFVHQPGKWLDTWLASRVCGTFHERVPGALNQMPQAILQRIIQATSNPGGLVLDFFGGTFSTGIAAVNLGRNFRGFDISTDYCHGGRSRLKAAVQVVTNL